MIQEINGLSKSAAARVGYSIHLKSWGFNTIGFDLGKQYLSYGKELYDLDLKNKNFTPDDLPGKADLIIYNHVLEHVLNPVEELKLARTALSDEGLLYIAVPGIKWLYFSYDMNFLKFIQNAHVWHFSLTTLKNLCGVSGFRLLHGDEKIRIIAMPSKTLSNYNNDFCDVVAFLQTIEIKRRHFFLSAFFLAPGPGYRDSPSYFIFYQKAAYKTKIDKLNFKEIDISYPCRRMSFKKMTLEKRVSMKKIIFIN